MSIPSDSRAEEIGGEWDSVWHRIFLEARENFGLATEGEFDGLEEHIYILAYDFGLAQGVCGENSMVGVGIRKGLMDAIRMSSINPSPQLLNMAIELGIKHGILIAERIRAEIFISNNDINFSKLHADKSKFKQIK